MTDKEHKATDEAIVFIQEVARFLWSLAALLAPWLVPLAPAIFFGWTIYQTAIDADMGTRWATWAAIGAAVGLETVNIAANHAMLRLSHNVEDHKGKFALSIFFIFVYVIIGVVAMLMLPVEDGVRIIGVGLFLLAPVAIGAQALTMDLVRVKDEAHKREKVEAEERQRRWALEDAQANRDHQRRLELDRLRWQHKTDVALSGEHSEHSTYVREQPPERSPDYDQRLAVIRERSADILFSPADVQDWLGVSRTTSHEVLKYGQSLGDVQQVSRGQYRMNGKDN